MAALLWSRQNLSLLGRVYLRKVRAKMRGLPGAFVQFGQTGNGTAPNYQVTLAPGAINAYRGLSHKRFEEAEAFDNENISGGFTLAEIDDAIEAASVRWT